MSDQTIADKVQNFKAGCLRSGKQVKLGTPGEKADGKPATVDDVFADGKFHASTYLDTVYISDRAASYNGEEIDLAKGDVSKADSERLGLTPEKEKQYKYKAYLSEGELDLAKTNPKEKGELVQALARKFGKTVVLAKGSKAESTFALLTAGKFYVSSYILAPGIIYISEIPPKNGQNWNLVDLTDGKLNHQERRLLGLDSKKGLDEALDAGCVYKDTKGNEWKNDVAVAARPEPARPAAVATPKSAPAVPAPAAPQRPSAPATVPPAVPPAAAPAPAAPQRPSATATVPPAAAPAPAAPQRPSAPATVPPAVPPAAVPAPAAPQRPSAPATVPAVQPAAVAPKRRVATTSGFMGRIGNNGRLFVSGEAVYKSAFGKRTPAVSSDDEPGTASIKLNIGGGVSDVLGSIIRRPQLIFNRNAKAIEAGPKTAEAQATGEVGRAEETAAERALRLEDEKREKALAQKLADPMKTRQKMVYVEAVKIITAAFVKAGKAPGTVAVTGSKITISISVHGRDETTQTFQRVSVSNITAKGKVSKALLVELERELGKLRLDLDSPIKRENVTGVSIGLTRDVTFEIPIEYTITSVKRK